MAALLKRSNIGSMRRALVKERAARRKMTDEQRKQNDRERARPIARARDRSDPKGTARYLVQLAMRLKEGETLSAEERFWLADALIEAALSPENAGALLGLVRAKQRPTSDAFLIRNIKIAERIFELSAHMRIGDTNHGGEGAITRAAREFSVSGSSAGNAWKAHGAAVKAHQESKSGN